MAHGFVQVQMTTESRQSAEKLVRSIVGARLAACGQVVGPISSTFWWQNEIQKSDEYLVLLKTTVDRQEQLVEHIHAEHPYETPEVIVTPVAGGSAAYLNWVAQETGSTSG